MYKEFNRKHSFVEVGIWNRYPLQVLGLEFGPTVTKEYWSITFGLTIFSRVLFFIEYTRWRDDRDHSSVHPGYEAEF